MQGSWGKCCFSVILSKSRHHSCSLHSCSTVCFGHGHSALCCYGYVHLNCYCYHMRSLDDQHSFSLQMQVIILKEHLCSYLRLLVVQTNRKSAYVAVLNFSDPVRDPSFCSKGVLCGILMLLGTAWMCLGVADSWLYYDLWEYKGHQIVLQVSSASNVTVLALILEHGNCWQGAFRPEHYT